jgi:LacI family transcriptional regulator
MPTIHDVAKKAGVAPITVSRVVNNSGYVSDSVRNKVNLAIEELGYVPNIIARSLRSKRTNTIALVFTDITNPFFNILARGVEDAAFEAGFNVIICNTDESQEQEDNYIQLLLQKQVDGILLVPADTHSKSIELIRKHNTPLVIVDRCIEDGGVDIVRGDSEGGAYQLTKFLIELGHKRITLMSGPNKVSTSVDRVNGYLQAMVDHGLEGYIDYFYGSYSQESGANITRQVFARNEKPTAIFGGNNLISIGALSALREMGYKIPDDVAVVSFDDIPENFSYFPFMTVIAQPPYEIGQRATQILISRIKDSDNPPIDFQEIVFPVELVVRESSGGKINKS